jgi:hypothetical protein
MLHLRLLLDDRASRDHSTLNNGVGMHRKRCQPLVRRRHRQRFQLVAINSAMPFEHARRSVTRVLTMRKPFDVLAEGLISEKSRGDWTPLELFLAGVGAGKPDCVGK